MKKFLKRSLYRTIGQENYLSCLHKGFYLAYGLGLLKNNPAYQFNYLIRHLVDKGDAVLDLGANLGYFAKAFSDLVGKEGEVICVEPVRPFFKVLKKTMGNRRNVVLYNYALGTENKMIKMVVPKMDGYLRTGLAHVPTSEEPNSGDQYEFTVEMVRGSELLKSISRLDYIKCDIEGYEEVVLPEIRAIIEKHKPMIQVETWGTHRDIVFQLLEELGYVRYGLINNLMTKNIDLSTYGLDYIFVHIEKENAFIDRLRTRNLLG